MTLETCLNRIKYFSNGKLIKIYKKGTYILFTWKSSYHLGERYNGLINYEKDICYCWSVVDKTAPYNNIYFTKNFSTDVNWNQIGISESIKKTTSLKKILDEIKLNII
jgi:hypothetical protein